MAEEELLQELFERGAHYGSNRRRHHPSVKPYLYGFRGRTAIIDLERTSLDLSRAEALIKEIAARGGLWLLVGTKPEVQAAVRAAGERLGCPYVTRRWIGGTLTNFSEIRKRLERLAELKRLLDQRLETASSAEPPPAGQGLAGESIISKQERVRLNEERRRLEHSFAGLENLTAPPAVLTVVDSRAEAVAVAEGRRLALPIVSISGTDCDVRLIDYPIVANDANSQTIEYLLNRLADAYEAGRKSASDLLKTPPVSPAGPVDNYSSPLVESETQAQAGVNG